MGESTFIGKAPCPSCRESGEDKSGDNLAVYDDGHGYCFKCGHVVDELLVGRPPNLPTPSIHNIVVLVKAMSLAVAADRSQ